MNHNAAHYDSVLGQITETFSAGHHNHHAVREKWHRNMGFCRAAVIAPLNGDAMVVEVAGGDVAVLGEVPAGMTAAEAAKKFCLGGSLPCSIHSSYFRHWHPMNESPLLHDGVLVELTVVGDTDNGVNCDATWSRVMMKKKECEAAVLAILDAPDSEPIAATIACHRVWKMKKNATKLKLVNESINDAKKEDEEIEAKKVASKKKAVEKCANIRLVVSHGAMGVPMHKLVARR